jgi:hypothetical protein
LDQKSVDEKKKQGKFRQSLLSSNSITLDELAKQKPIDDRKKQGNLI